MKNNLKTRIGLLFNELRKNNKLSITRLAQITGVSYKTIHDIERGNSDAKISTLIKICRGFSISLIKLFKIAEIYKSGH